MRVHLQARPKIDECHFYTHSIGQSEIWLQEHVILLISHDVETITLLEPS